MKNQLVLLVAVLCLATLGCRSQPKDLDAVRKKNPDVEAELYVSNEDSRYVNTEYASGRQIHYYSAKKNKTFVIDEKSGAVVRTFDSKTMPTTVVVDPAPVEVKPAAGACGCAAKPACGSADDGYTCGCAEPIESGCGAAKSGCGCG